jgi:signal transduction histidine kinase
LGYVVTIAACLTVGMLAGWNHIAVRIDNQTYDFLSDPLPKTGHEEAVIAAVDSPTLRASGERDKLRQILTGALETIATAHPAAVALDITLGGYSDDAVDTKLAAALKANPNLVLPSQEETNQWEDPAPKFREAAAALGHVHHERDDSDGVSRQLTLEKIHAGDHRWALSLEAFRLAHNSEILASPDDIEVAGVRIPAPYDRDRVTYIRYLALDAIPVISILDLDKHLDLLRGKTVFLGVTSQDLANDRLKIPTGETIPGVAVHAQAYETLRRGQFLEPASTTLVLGICIAFATAIGLTFAYLQGWPAYAVVFPLLALALSLPKLFLPYDVVFPLTAPTAVAWLCAAGAATFQHFIVRRSLQRSESDKARYQQAIHWAAHEMRTPLTAIQGSSEIMSRYKLPDDKRNQMSEMINSESKRLARIIQTFLDVERLGAGEMELKKETFPASAVVDTCMARVTPLAERKNIQLTLDTEVDGTLMGDRELMEYAFYNLLTNAVKYSPPDTHIRVRSEKHGPELRLAVQDEGIGMDAKELKNIFKKFYRTKKAEQSGEAGTGIGLSIVQQIVTHHGGKIDVTSIPGKGSCFTIVMSAQ